MTNILSPMFDKPLPAQRRAWIMVVCQSSAMDTKETQTLLGHWVAKGTLSEEQWDRLHELAVYVTSEQYIEDEKGSDGAPVF